MTGSVASGLEGVVVADTALSEVDGERGRLVIAGHDVEAIAGQRSFEELCALMNRARRSGVGYHLFQRGGFVVEGGHAVDTARPCASVRTSRNVSR